VGNKLKSVQKTVPRIFFTENNVFSPKIKLLIMKIHKLYIKNFKGFEEKTFEFNPHFTILIGDNATGKTSILDAISILMGQFFQGLENIKVPKIEEKYVRIKYIKGQPKPQKPCILQAEGFVNHEKIGQENWKISNEIQQENEKIKSIATTILQNSRSEKKANKAFFPLIAYYGTGRLYKTSINNIDFLEQKEGFEMAYSDALNIDISGRHFLSWFKTQIASKKSLSALEKKHTKAFKNTILSLFPNEDMIDIDFNFKINELSFIFYPQKNKKDRKVWWYNQLSDGYRNIIGLAADIAYRCIQLNPHLGENAVKNTEGIVLIDEIDLHLHPKWQRRIVEDLKRIFPKIQFVATTHSPFIVQSLKSDELIVLDEKERGGNPQNRSLEEIVEVEMGLENMIRSVRFEKMLATAEEYFNLIAQGKNSKNDTYVAQLRQRLNELEEYFSEDAAFIALLKAERKSAKL